MKKMIKENKLNAVLSTVIILLPMLAGAVLWNKLPDSMTVHFGASGVADGFSSKAFAVFGLPLILSAFHWLTILLMSLDKNTTTQSKKIVGVLFYLMPMISVIACSTIYFDSFKKGSGNLSTKILFSFIGFLIIAMGNYLPKVTTNSTVGIKIPWAYTSEENWRKTHRFGGVVWVVCGVVVLCSALLPGEWIIASLIVSVAVMIIAPTAYSYCLYKKELQSGKCKAIRQAISATNKKIAAITSVLVAAVLVLLVVVTFTGNIDFSTNPNCIFVKASFYQDTMIAYDDIKSAELRESDSVGMKTNGFNSARLLMGTFKNDEFGAYTRYTYTGESTCIVLRDADGNTMVLGAKTKEETVKLYEEISECVNAD